jgi:hypothetical protein
VPIKNMKRQTELLAEVERLIFIVAIVALITLVGWNSSCSSKLI